MRLRTRLALGFSLLALVPLGIVLPSAARDLKATFDRQIAAEAERAASVAQQDLRRRLEEAQRRMDELAQGPELAAMGDALSQSQPFAQVRDWAEPVMSSHGLTALALLDASGTTLSSGQLPARAGDPDPQLLALVRGTQPQPALLPLEVRDGESLAVRPAYLFWRRIETPQAFGYLVGGLQLDPALVNELANLTGAEVRLSTSAGVVARAGAVEPPLFTRAVPLGPGIQLELGLSTAPVRAAQAALRRAVALALGVGLALALLLALVLSRSTTRPLEALAQGARRIAGGDWSGQVEAQGGAEVGALVAAFNQMTRTLSQTRAELIRAERIGAWQEVAKRLAHELKNPLTPIQMSLETLLAAQAQKSPRFAELFSQSARAMLEEVARLKRTVDAFSSFARLPKPNVRALELSGLLSGLVRLHAPDCGALRVQLSLDPPVWVEADPDQLTQVFVNLVKNATEAMEAQGTIFVRAKVVSAQAVVEVEDTGPGVPAAVREQLFTPYLTTKPSGTGLGLALSARICQEHGGRLELGGSPAGGALFRVVLPAVTAPQGVLPAQAGRA